MNNRYKILYDYFATRLERDKDLIARADRVFSEFDKLAAEQNVSNDIADACVGAATLYGEVVIEVLSKCPFLEIKLNNTNDMNL